MNHLFVTQDYAPDLGGMARRHVELCRRFSDERNTMSVSTVAAHGPIDFDSGEAYEIHRQPFPFSGAKRFVNQMRWSRWLNNYCRNKVDVIHCGNIRPVGYAVFGTHLRLRVPYLVYVNGGDLLRELRKAKISRLKRVGAGRMLGNASGIVATSDWVAALAGEVMDAVGIKAMPPVVALALGTDPVAFNPSRDSGKLRARWKVGTAPLIITVARLVPHKGQDMGIRALAALRPDFPELRYIIVGEGEQWQSLRDLAQELGVGDRVCFAGAMRDDELPEAYATSTVYLGASRVDLGINAEGFGISFLEASASGLPIVAGDSGGVRSAVRDGETGVVVPPTDVDSIAHALRGYLSDENRRRATGAAGRKAVETHYNWDRVARDTREFTQLVVRR